MPLVAEEVVRLRPREQVQQGTPDPHASVSEHHAEHPAGVPLPVYVEPRVEAVILAPKERVDERSVEGNVEWSGGASQEKRCCDEGTNRVPDGIHRNLGTRRLGPLGSRQDGGGEMCKFVRVGLAYERCLALDSGPLYVRRCVFAGRSTSFGKKKQRTVELTVGLPVPITS